MDWVEFSGVYASGVIEVGTADRGIEGQRVGRFQMHFYHHNRNNQ